MESVTTKTLSGATGIITTKEARSRLETEIQQAMSQAEDSLIDAPTSLGKSHTIATTPWRDYPTLTGGKSVIHLHQSKNARDDAAKKSKRAGVTYRVIEGGMDSCPVAAGDYDTELTAPDGTSPSTWFDRKCYKERVPFSAAHKHLRTTLGSLPCEEDGKCTASARWKGLRQDDDTPAVDVIHATSMLAHVDWFIEGANVIFDERPSFIESFNEEEHERFRRSVNTLLRHRSEEGLTWASLIHAVRSEDTQLLSKFEQMFADDFTKSQLFEEKYVHKRAPPICSAMSGGMNATQSRLTGHYGRTSVVLNSENTIRRVLHRPYLESARCVIGLDAFPSKRLWELNTVEPLHSRSVLTDNERRRWRRNERGLEIRQVGINVNYVTKGWKSESQEEKADAIIKELRKMYETEFRTAITSKDAESSVQKMMRDAGIDDYETLYYGHLRSNNDFTGERVGLLLGAIDPGDEYVLDMLALSGLNARPETIEGNRAQGRGFVGPDSEAARGFLDAVREESIAQGIGRYARSPKSDSSRATVYVWTAAIPEPLVDDVVAGPGVEVTELMRTIEVFVRENSPVTAKEVREGVDVPEAHNNDTVSQKHVLEVFERLEEQEIVTIHKGKGAHGADQCEYQRGSLGRAVHLGME